MNIAEQKLDLFHQIDELPEDLLKEAKRLIAQLKLKQKTEPKRQVACMKGLVTYMADDFNAPLDEFKPYTESVWLGIEQWRNHAKFSDMTEVLTDEMVDSWRDKSSGRDFSWTN